MVLKRHQRVVVFHYEGVTLLDQFSMRQPEGISDAQEAIQSGGKCLKTIDHKSEGSEKGPSHVYYNY